MALGRCVKNYDGKPWKAMMESKVKRDAKGNTEEGGERWDE